MATQLKHTVKPSGGDFTSLDACLDHMESAHADLVTADVYADIEIDGEWSADDTSAVIVQNFTTDSTHYINVYTTATARHDGKRFGSKSTAYRLVAGTYLIYALQISETFVTINGLQVRGNSGTYKGAIKPHAGAVSLANGAPIIKNCILKATGTDARSGIAIIDSHSVLFYNNIVDGAQGSGIYLYNNTSSSCVIAIYNNTVIGCTSYGINNSWSSGAVQTWKNNLSMNNTLADFCMGESNWDTTADNMSEDGTAPDDSATYTYADQFVNTGTGTQDYHLKAGANAIDAGSDISSIFTTDIDGDTRTGTWDVGADEYVSASVTGFMTCNKGMW